MADLGSSIASAVAGGLVGALLAWNKDRQTAKQHIMDFLREKRLELDTRTDLLRIVTVLREECGGKVPNEQIKPEEMRNLPAFLEPIGTYLLYNPVTFRKAYGYFSEEVLLCAKSTRMWLGDLRYDKSVYWRSFTKFVMATRRSGYGLERRSSLGALQ
jgi:argininosuccinate lyase